MTQDKPVSQEIIEVLESEEDDGIDWSFTEDFQDFQDKINEEVRDGKLETTTQARPWKPRILPISNPNWLRDFLNQYVILPTRLESLEVIEKRLPSLWQQNGYKPQSVFTLRQLFYEYKRWSYFREDIPTYSAQKYWKNGDCGNGIAQETCYLSRVLTFMERELFRYLIKPTIIGAALREALIAFRKIEHCVPAREFPHFTSRLHVNRWNQLNFQQYQEGKRFWSFSLTKPDNDHFIMRLYVHPVMKILKAIYSPKYDEIRDLAWEY